MADEDNADHEYSEAIQDYINGIISEEVQYGWVNYGADTDVLTSVVSGLLRERRGV